MAQQALDMVVPLEVGLCVADLDNQIAFYTGVLGLAHVNTVEVPTELAIKTGLTDGSYRVARLQTPQGERLKLLQPATPPADPGPSGPILGRRTNAYLTFIIADLPAMIARVQAAGLTLLSGDRPMEVRPGTFLAFLEDPEGNVLEFVQYADIAAYRPDLG